MTTATRHPARRAAPRSGKTAAPRRALRPRDPAYAAMALQWRELCADASLRDLPYKIETTGAGTITMSPASNRHSRYQGKIERLLGEYLPAGESFPECSVATPDGVKVADVAWASAQFLVDHGDQTPYQSAPDICVEVSSPSNSTTALQAKITGYLARGAREVWVCGEDGQMSFHDHRGPLKRSVLCPRFPTRIR